jgi:dTDP-4-amino-4,6-dideoxygalactose transaminase
LKVPLLDLRAQYETIRNEIEDGIRGVLESQQFILGAEVRRFEETIASYLRCRHAIGVASGSDALLLSLMALGIGAGDGVIVSPFTFFSTVSAITRLGARPFFVDVDSESGLVSPPAVEAFLHDHVESRADNAAATEKKTRCRLRVLLPVHLYGQACAMDALLPIAGQYGLKVVEDVAQAMGAQVSLDGIRRAAGTVGLLGCFSFFPSKNLGAFGDAGLVGTNDDTLARKIRLLRVHGQTSKYRHEMIGLNSRLDSLQARVLEVKLRHLDRWCADRVERARLYRSLFSATGLLDAGIVGLPPSPSDRSHVYNYYVIRCRRRDELRDYLSGQGIGTEIYYPIPLHLQPCFAYLGYRKGDFPNAEKLASEVLALPIYPELSGEQQEYVVEEIRRFYEP